MLYSNRLSAVILICLFGLVGKINGQNPYKVGIVGFYNLENLFDTIKDPTIRDYEFLPDGERVWNTEKYTQKLQNMARVISEIGTNYSPDGVAVLGVSEIENRSVLEDLVQQEAITKRNYQIVHEDSPDERGIDVGLIYNPKYFTYQGHDNVFVKLSRSDGSPDYTRDILHVWGLFDGELIHFLVNHWPSRGGGQAASNHKREYAASLNKKIADSLMQSDPMAKVVIMGDLNDDPISPSVKDVLNVQRKRNRVQEGDLFSAYHKLFRKGIGTLAYRDTWNLFDQIILSYGLVEEQQDGYRLYKANVFSKDYLYTKQGNFRGYPFRTFGGSLYQGGYSDHFPVYCVLIKPS